MVTVDIPGAFMQANMEDLVHMKLEGKMAELLVKLDHKLYRKHIQIEKITSIVRGTQESPIRHSEGSSIVLEEAFS